MRQLLDDLDGCGVPFTVTQDGSKRLLITDLCGATRYWLLAVEFNGVIGDIQLLRVAAARVNKS